MIGRRERNLSRPSDMTSRYYEEHAKEFYDQTVSVNMASVYPAFLEEIRPGGHILDAGCGSGRDTLYFRDHGYQVTAFDACEKLAALASNLTGQNVLTLRFEEITFEGIFDGVWACASLLHISRGGMDAVMVKLTDALKPNGVMFVSFKLRNGEWEQNGRFFNGYDQHSFGALVQQHDALSVVSVWVSEDVRPERSREKWLNALLRRVK